MTINDRIKEIRKYHNLSQKELAEKIGMSQNAISWSEKTGNNIPDSTIKSICTILNVNEEYLRYGNGPKFSTPNTFSLDKFIEDRGGTDLELEIVKTYFELDPEIRKAILSHFKEKFSPSSYESLYDSVPDTAEELEAQFQLVTDHDKEVG